MLTPRGILRVYNASHSNLASKCMFRSYIVHSCTINIDFIVSKIKGTQIFRVISLTLESQSLILHKSPSQPSSHWHLFATHRPCAPQLMSQRVMEQSSPLYFALQIHFWVWGSNFPWFEQLGRQGMAAWSSMLQSRPNRWGENLNFCK